MIADVYWICSILVRIQGTSAQWHGLVAYKQQIAPSPGGWKPEIRVPAGLDPVRAPIQAADFDLLYPHHMKREPESSLGSFEKGTDPIHGDLAHDLIPSRRSHLLLLSHWELGSQHLLGGHKHSDCNTYHTLDTVLKALDVFSLLSSHRITELWGGCYYYLRFIRVETEAQRGCSFLWSESC